MYPQEIEKIVTLVGKIEKEDVRQIEYFLSENMGVFMPVSGPCQYSISKDHTHPAYSFVLVFDRFSSLSLDGKEITTEPGSVCAISPEIAHHEITSSTLSRFIAIFIDRKFFEEVALSYPGISGYVFRGESFIPGGALLSFLKEFMNEYENQLPGHENILQSLEVVITHTLLRSIVMGKIFPSRNAARIEVIKAIEYIHIHYSSEILVEKLAAVAGMSYSHFARIFKQETGLSLSQYLIHTRLTKAKQMLRDKNKSLTEIALACGFNSHAHFTSKFSEVFKIPPREYKKSLNIG